jgi:hypothetical protein
MSQMVNINGQAIPIEQYRNDWALKLIEGIMKNKRRNYTLILRIIYV